MKLSMWGQIRPKCPHIFRRTWLVVGQSHLSESSLDQPSCCYSLGCYFVSKAETLVNWTLFGKRLANIASERRKVFGKLLFAIAVSLFQISSKDLYQVLEILKKLFEFSTNGAKLVDSCFDGQILRGFLYMF